MENIEQNKKLSDSPFIKFLANWAFTLAVAAFVLSYYFTAITIIAWIVWIAGMIGCVIQFKKAPTRKKYVLGIILLAVSFGNLLLWTMLGNPALFGGSWAIIQFISVNTKIFYGLIL